MSEPCPRCGHSAMLWIQSSWQCPRCRFKQGCCDGYSCDMHAYPPDPIVIETGKPPVRAERPPSAPPSSSMTHTVGTRTVQERDCYSCTA